MCTSLFAGYLTRKFDFRAVIFVGYMIAAYSMWTMTSWSLDMGRGPILIAAFIQGLGFGLIVSPMQVMAFATLNPRLRPDGSSLMTLFRSFGGSIGISVIVTMLSRNSQVSHADLASHITATSIPAVDLPSVVNRMGEAGGGVMAMINGEVSRQAMMVAFLDNFYMITWILLAFAPLPLLLKKAKPMGKTEKLPIIE
jgi:DHA2 family multidrug resistance protein